ncbi:TnpV protein [Ruminobacter sp.]|uniref:TnpV protein n=1 Tax=Ruminobacter sp. TaxID=2774296 RepID=UPI003869BE13
MEKYIYNGNNGLWYELQGDYYIPCLTLGEEEKRPIGKWGRKHLRYLKEHRPVLYTVLLLGGKLSSHLAEIDIRATEIYEQLMQQMVQQNGINEQLKAKDPMAWVGAMNNIRSAAEEIVNAEVIFAW